MNMSVYYNYKITYYLYTVKILVLIQFIKLLTTSTVSEIVLCKMKKLKRNK